MDKLSRRQLAGSAALGLLVADGAYAAESEPVSVPDNFPMQPAALAREMVTVSHGNVKRVRELVEAHTSLAKASWDWGFGDWETALGAASHVGNREIAELLIANGAGPTIFSATMLGQIEAVKAFIAASPGVQRTAGPHSISLLNHAKAGGKAAEEVRQYLESLGDAGGPAPKPFPAEDAAALAGTYLFGSGPLERIEIAVVKGQLTFTRSGTVARGLVHLGERAFHPAGASAVRIRFKENAGIMVMTVHDPDVVLMARRAAA